LTTVSNRVRGALFVITNTPTGPPTFSQFVEAIFNAKFAAVFDVFEFQVGIQLVVRV
jgi:hypothetical protein